MKEIRKSKQEIRPQHNDGSTVKMYVFEGTLNDCAEEFNEMLDSYDDFIIEIVDVSQRIFENGEMSLSVIIYLP